MSGKGELNGLILGLPILIFVTELSDIYREDVNMKFMTRTQTRYNCPIKGDASIWSIEIGDVLYMDIAWSYEKTIEYSKSIERRMAFDVSRVSIKVEPLEN